MAIDQYSFIHFVNSVIKVRKNAKRLFNIKTKV